MWKLRCVRVETTLLAVGPANRKCSFIHDNFSPTEENGVCSVTVVCCFSVSSCVPTPCWDASIAGNSLSGRGNVLFTGNGRSSFVISSQHVLCSTRKWRRSSARKTTLYRSGPWEPGGSPPDGSRDQVLIVCWSWVCNGFTGVPGGEQKSWLYGKHLFDTAPLCLRTGLGLTDGNGENSPDL